MQRLRKKLSDLEAEFTVAWSAKLYPELLSFPRPPSWCWWSGLPQSSEHGKEPPGLWEMHWKWLDSSIGWAGKTVTHRCFIQLEGVSSQLHQDVFDQHLLLSQNMGLGFIRSEWGDAHFRMQNSIFLTPELRLQGGSLPTQICLYTYKRSAPSALCFARKFRSSNFIHVAPEMWFKMLQAYLLVAWNPLKILSSHTLKLCWHRFHITPK